MTLALLCAGAVKGLVLALEPSLEPSAAPTLEARFGAVGAMRDALREGAPCDVLVLTAAMLAGLEASGEVRAGSSAAIGRVRTGVAVVAGAPVPAIDTAEALRAAVLGASAIYVPDTARSTAGLHVAGVLRGLGVHDEVAARIRMYPNGATAMGAMAASGDPAALGCTQVTEIRYTPGLELVGPLPAAFELATVYSAAIARGARDEPAARRFIERLTGASSLDLRLAGGFDIDPELT